MNDDTKQLNEQIQNLNIKIKELEQDIQMEKMVKKSEVTLNAELLQRIEKLELHIETLIKINEEYSNMVAQLRLTIKKIISNPKID
jgi:chaperonin cofactor prefoldin